jgi:uncharacterized protein YwqG
MTRVRIQDVLAAWEKQEAALGVLGVRRENKLVVEADRLVAQALTDKGRRKELLALLDLTNDERLKDWLRSRLLPDIVDARTDPHGFRTHPLVDFTAEQMPIKSSLALVEVKGKSKKRDVLVDLYAPGSWLAGAPVSDVADWPTDHSGVPLAHIVQVDLGGVATDDWPGDVLGDLGLPDTGVLQLFHDLATYGSEPVDKKADGWQVRWVRQPNRLLSQPEQMDETSFRPAQRVHAIPALSVPSAEVFRAKRAVWERYERVAEHIEDQLYTPRHRGMDKDDQRPSAWETRPYGTEEASRMGGFGFNPLLEEFREVLEEVLPLEQDDEYFLLFDLAGVRHLEDWFGDCGHLQVWIRRRELAARRFDDVWCFIRTD